MAVSETQIEAGARAIDPAAFEQDEDGCWLQSADRDAALKASRRCLTAALSDQAGGWQLVPKEPSKMMIEAGTIDLGYDDDYNPVYLHKDEAEQVYRAMIAVAPPPSSTAGEG